VVNFMTRLLYSQEKSCQYTLARTLSGTQSQSGHDDKEKNY